MDIEARIVDGAKPNALDSLIECEKRGYGTLKTAGFRCGVLRVTVTNFKPVDPSSPRRAAWEAEGMKWANEEIARRAAPRVGDYIEPGVRIVEDNEGRYLTAFDEPAEEAANVAAGAKRRYSENVQ